MVLHCFRFSEAESEPPLETWEFLEEKEEGKQGGGGEECEKAKIMTEKADQTATGLAQSRDLFESEAEDNLKRSQSCVCNNIVCDCDENPDSLSLLDNC